MKSLAELTENIGQLLNERCKSRFHRLTLSQADWGGENEKPMDIASANLFVDFITQYTKTYTIDADDLSIFLNYDGCIVTSWSAKNTADTIDLFFMEKEIEVCSNQFEFTSEINEELFSKKSQTIKALKMKTMEELAITIGELLDETCETRFRRLIECQDGWGGRDEKAMRLDSANEFVNFISLYVSKYSLDASDVGIFFNDEGYVSTSWHAKNSSDLIDITFTDGIIGVYTNGFEIESVISDELLKTIFEY